MVGWGSFSFAAISVGGKSIFVVMNGGIQGFELIELLFHLLVAGR